MYLETIQRLSMYIVRKFKEKMDETGAGSSQLSQETISNIRSLMDEHVFDLLDKTEVRVLNMKKQNIELLEELVHVYQEQLTTQEQISMVYAMMSELQSVITDLIPLKDRSLSLASNLPLANSNIKTQLPEPILSIFNRVYAHRFELDKQSQQVRANRELYEKKLSKFDAKLSLLKKTNEEHWQDALDKTPFGDKKEDLHQKIT